MAVRSDAVAWWHLHPAEDRSDNASFQRSADSVNRNFSPDDVTQARVLAEHRTPILIPAYISAPTGKIYRNDQLWNGAKGTVELEALGQFRPSAYFDRGRN